MQEVYSFLLSIGLQLNIEQCIADAKWHRCRAGEADKKESGAFKIYQNSTRDGRVFYVVIAENHRDGEGIQRHCTLTGKISKEDRALIKQQMDRASQEAEAERTARQMQVAADCAAKWELLAVEGTSEYLMERGITELHGARLHIDPVFRASTLIVPMRDTSGKLWSLQRITAEGKRFEKGGRVQGCFHQIGELREGEPLYIVEGFATGISVHLATGGAVYVSFQSGNLLAVARALRAEHKDRGIIICGDDDRTTEGNPGRKAADEAAKAVMGVAIFPCGIEGSDFDDLRQEKGLSAVKEQLQQCEEPEANFVVPLGFKEKNYFFTSSHNEQIVSIANFSQADFLGLMPLEYWEANYPPMPGSKSSVNWTGAVSDLMEAARQRGYFEHRKIRGAGIWNDAGRVVVNMGDHLIVDGRITRYCEMRSEYFYTLGIKLPPLHTEPLTLAECEKIWGPAQAFRWKNSDAGYLLAGAIVTTRICGALPIRPHLWITGERGSGKTTLLNRYITPLIGNPVVSAGGNSSEAGLRQALNADAIPVVYDEFENSGRKSAEMIQSVLDLFRMAWSETNASIIKGSSNGLSQSYHVRCAAIVASIRQVHMNDADRSRFATLELAPHQDDPEQWDSLDAMLAEIDIELGNRLFARVVRMLPILLENFRTMKRALQRRASGQRFGDQYGMLLAGYGLLLWDTPMSDADADCIAGHVRLEEERREAKVTDQEMCLNHLLTKKLQFEDMSVADKILAEREKIDGMGLAGYGIRVDKEWFAVQVQHTELESFVFKDTRWSKNWGLSLARLPGAERKKVRYGALSRQSIVLPVKLITE